MSTTFKALLGATAISALAALTMGATPAVAGICPAIGADTDCGILITLKDDGTASIDSFNPPQGPYDGIEDTLVGIVNNSGAAVSAVTLKGSFVFGFDGDGIQMFPYLNPPPGPGGLPPGYVLTGYEGPTTYFSGINVDNTSPDFLSTGTVNFIGGLRNGASTYFSLEEDLNAASFTVTGTTPAPEPATLALLGAGLAGLGAIRRRRNKKSA